MGVRVEEAPPRVCPVDPLVDVLPDRGIEAVVALGKAADPEMTATTR